MSDDEDERDQNQYGGGNDEGIDAVDQTERRMGDQDDDENGDDGDGDSDSDSDSDADAEADEEEWEETEHENPDDHE